MSDYDIGELKAGGLMKQKEKDLFSIRLHLVGGRLEGEQLLKLQSLAERFGDGHVHLTVRQGVEIPNVKFDDFPALKAELAEVGLSMGACGRRVRTVTACQGETCSHGLIPAQAIGKKLDEQYYGHGGLPHKFKITVTGCPNACMKPHENDLGVMGVITKGYDDAKCDYCGLCAEVCPVDAIEVADGKLAYFDDKCIGCGDCVFACPTGAWREEKQGYRIFIGGKMGKFPKLAYTLYRFVEGEDKLTGLVDAVLALYKKHGKQGERLRETIDRIGLEQVKKECKGGV
jgi:anaerobic sulfite reductase subunit C